MTRSSSGDQFHQARTQTQPDPTSRLRADDFDAFFTALWGHQSTNIHAFQWQQDLAERVLTHAHSPWPEAIALPTAAGKTACMDIAIFALAAQAINAEGKHPQITAPRRLFFVVDRRLIVDEAFERAQAIAKQLQTASSGILKTVADALRQIGGNDTPLIAHRLRGGMMRSEAWAKHPLQPTIVTSTVDQLGSRLLFRAYGRGPGMLPVYAGMIANDSLILLDEAHCAQPFLQTLKAVETYRHWAKAPLQRCFYPTILSATPPAGISDTFYDVSNEPSNPNHPLGRRQLAHKPAHLSISKAKGKKAIPILARDLVNAALAIDKNKESPLAIVIFVNRVATARAAFELLKSKSDIDPELLTGRMRAVDKDSVTKRLHQQLASAHAKTRVLDKTLIVVATQTLEVGADFDFDALVTECAPLDSLRQRFGRLNRMGRDIPAPANIIIRADQEKTSEDDPVYGAALANTWQWLTAHQDEQQCIDFGIAHLTPRLPTVETEPTKAFSDITAATLDAPVMLPAHIDCWAQTAPIPEPSPEVGLFLHGLRNSAADVQVCFRADLSLNTEANRHNSLELLALCPPSSTECLPVPIGVFKRWLNETGSEDHSSDIEGTDSGIEAENRSKKKTPASPGRLYQIIRWADNNKAEIIDQASGTQSERIRPADLIVIPITQDCWQGLGDFPESATDKAERLDVGDQAYRTAHAKNLIRLHPHLIDTWPEGAAKSAATALLTDLQAIQSEDNEADSEAFSDMVRHLLNLLAKSNEYESHHQSWLPKAAQQLHDELQGSRLHQAIHRIGSTSLVIKGKRLIPELLTNADGFSDESDASSSGTSSQQGRPVYLRDHLPGVEDLARQFAQRSGLSDDLINTIALAGLLHDLGKADPRFQALLRGGNHWLSGEPLAKSTAIPNTRSARKAARIASGYPSGGRHELLSVRMAESIPELLPAPGLMRDLVLHLIASHHGHCRPFAPVIEDPSPPSVHYTLGEHHFEWNGHTALERLDSGVSERYWRLVRHYGWWGLAWLEALLRLADHRRSEWEQGQ